MFPDPAAVRSHVVV